MFIDSMKDSGS